ncbi:carbonic anhydrase [Paraflavitalea soli]|uniref:Carbonic anhydrase n=1 Tax=Paraflavitalea soli TaxID=2315862 RepID=A0A3B7MPD2_9BACT|nr:carbonic anhydrase family protein [Paraflavitalea soli]AXY74836.1 carbonic anhydrase [Paraflavitalea soli]
MRTHSKETQTTTTPQMALQFLKEGNARFMNNLKMNRNLLEQVNDTKEGQWPFAVILSCIDSRTSAELIFDQGLGDVFSVRIAGNVINEDILGSMEFACKVAGSKLIVVLGHSKCGAIKGACNHVELGNLTGLLEKVQPAIEKVKEQQGSDDVNPQFIEAVAHVNTLHTMDAVLKRSPILKEMYENGEIGIAAGYYSVETGEVKFIKEKVLGPLAVATY